MNICKFINSKDIAEYLESINYQFSTIEAAYLVYQSKKATLEDKIEAWKEIIETYPDCACKRKFFATESMHQFLQDYIAWQEKCIQHFYDRDEAVYIWRMKYADEEMGDYDEGEIFASFEKCFDYIMNELAEEYNSDTSISAIQLKKVWLDHPGDRGKVIELTMNSNYKIMEVEESGLTDEEGDIDFAFEEMWINLPTPFKRGDIIVNCNWADNEPRVLDYLCTWDTKTMIENGASKTEEFVLAAGARLEKMLQTGDTSDMGAYGYEISEEGQVWCDDFSFSRYLDIEYYRKPLQGKQRFLRAISSFMQEKINIEFLVNTYRTIWLEEDNKRSKEWYGKIYGKDCYALGGMREEENVENILNI